MLGAKHGDGLKEAGWDLGMRKGGARQQCGRRETSAAQCTKAGETHRNRPGGKRPQERPQSKEQGLAKYLPWLCGGDLAPTNPAPREATGPRGCPGGSLSPSAPRPLNYDCKCQHTDPFFALVWITDL